MLTSEQLKKIVTETRPLIEQQLDLTEQVAGLREVVTAAGGDWSQLKALVKAQIQDERDDAGDGKRVRKILDKADYAQGYADMLGLGNLNEKNSFADADVTVEVRRFSKEEIAKGFAFDASTGEIIEGNEPASSEAQVRSERSGEGGEDAPALSADTQSQPGRSEAPRQIEAGLVAKVEDQSTAARTDVRDSTEGIAAPQPLNPEAATTPPAAGRSPVDTHPEPGNGEAGASPAPAPEPAAEGTAHNPIPSAVPGNMQNLHNAPGSIRTERTHTEGVERHQFAVWPEYQGRAHADLVDDVRTNGVREPIVMQGRIILDGWARYLAAREAGVSYPVQEYAGDDPLRDIITLNMASRSLNLVERQSIAKKLTKLAPDRADEIGELLDLQQQREAAQ